MGRTTQGSSRSYIHQARCSTNASILEYLAQRLQNKKISNEDVGPLTADLDGPSAMDLDGRLEDEDLDEEDDILDDVQDPVDEIELEEVAKKAKLDDLLSIGKDEEEEEEQD